MFQTFSKAILFLVLCNSAFASITLEPVDPYEIDSDNTIYYAASPLDSGIIDDDYTVFDLTVGQDNTTESNSSNPNLLYFDVSSDENFTVDSDSGEKLVVSVFAKVDGDEYYPVPIAAAEETEDTPGLCSSDQCQAQLRSGSDHYYAAEYTEGEVLRIGVYPSDICADVYDNSGGQEIDGCTDGSVETPTTGSPTNMDLVFVVGIVEDDESAIGEDDTYDESDEITLHFQVDAPVLSCPSEDYYFPGDKVIFVNPSDYGVTEVSGGAEIDKFVVVANKGEAAFITQDDFSDNDLVERVDYIDQDQTIEGFDNIESADDNTNTYELAFSISDKAGILAPFACTLSGVQTSKVDGFLNESKCFIATAAYRSKDAKTVQFLRKFRDQFLFKYHWGQKFVSFYYKHSPVYARWLVDHPQFRYPVILLLMPIKAVAWFLLNPSYFFVLMSFFLFTLFIYKRRLKINTSASLLILFFVFSPGGLLAEESSFIEQIQNKSENNDQDSYINRIKSSHSGDEDRTSFIDQVKDKSENKQERSSYIESVKKNTQKKSQGSIIESVQKGEKRPDAQKSGFVHHAAGIRVGTLINRTIAAGGSVGSQQFSTVYSDGWIPDFNFFYEYKAFQLDSVFSLGFLSTLGFTRHHGAGMFEFNLEKPWSAGEFFGSESQTEFDFYTIPFLLGINLSIDVLKYIRPYASAGVRIIGYQESRNDDQDGFRGYSKSLNFQGGVYILLDWLSRRSSWDSYLDNQILNTYLTIEYVKMTSFGSDVAIDLSGFYSGFTFEF